jgi:hypothetical protein
MQLQAMAKAVHAKDNGVGRNQQIVECQIVWEMREAAYERETANFNGC